jgi:hypothetical protein
MSCCVSRFQQILKKMSNSPIGTDKDHWLDMSIRELTWATVTTKLATLPPILGDFRGPNMLNMLVLPSGVRFVLYILHPALVNRPPSSLEKIHLPFGQGFLRKRKSEFQKSGNACVRLSLAENRLQKTKTKFSI